MGKLKGTYRCAAGHLLKASEVLQFDGEKLCSKAGSRKGKCAMLVRKISDKSLKEYRASKKEYHARKRKKA